MPAENNAIGRGVTAMLLGVVFFAVMDAMVKVMAERYEVVQVAFFRSLFGLVPLLPLLACDFPRGFHTKRPIAMGLRALLGPLGMLLIFSSFTMLTLAEVITISFAAPLIMTALSQPVLGEKVGWRRWTSVVIGFFGVLIVADPRGATVSLGVILALGGAFSIAVASISARALGRTESAAAMSFWSMGASVICLGALLPWYWQTPSLMDWGLFSVLGVTGGIAMLLVTSAFRQAPVYIVGPLDYLSLPFAAVIGFWIWGDLPRLNLYIGAGIIIATGLYILHRETLLGRAERKKAHIV